LPHPERRNLQRSNQAEEFVVLPGLPAPRRHLPCETPEYREYDTILSAVALNDEALLTRLSRNYQGVWHVFRYSAHVEPGADVLDTLADGSKNAWVVRAGMQVFERDTSIGRPLPTFRILYRPSQAVKRGHVFKTEGIVVPIGSGEHMQFIGVEYDSGYSLSIIAQHGRQPKDSFKGIVQRRHDHGEIFVSRVMFVKADHGDATLDQISSQFGLFKESQIREQLQEELPEVDADSLFNEIMNSVPNNGKCGLVL
jgi:hypothetical protein